MEAEALLESLFSTLVSNKQKGKVCAALTLQTTIKVKNMSMQSIWGQINYYTEESNRSMIKKLKRLTQSQEIKVLSHINS